MLERKTVSRIMLALLFISTLAPAFNTTPVQAGIKVSDDFNDNSINSDVWSEGQNGGPTVNEINQRLEIFFPWDSAGEVFGAGCWSECLLRGDFDIQVDFSLLDWPSVEQLGTGNGVRIGLAVGEGENWWSVQRTSFGSLIFDFAGYPREVYLCDLAGPVVDITPTDDMSGKLRLVRSGSTLTGYYFSSGSWIIVASGWVTTGDVWFSPNAWSHDDVFMDNSVLLAFDNFIVNSGRIVRAAWPPDEKWHPMSPEEARPEIATRIVIYGGEYDLEPSQAFYLWYRWGFLPSNKAYNLSDGELVTPIWNLQDRTDFANCRYTVTMNDAPLEQTDSFTAICSWYRFWNSPLPIDSGDYWAVAPRFVVDEYYIEFPQGLSEGTYEIFLYGRPSGGEPFSHTTFLHVE